MTHEQIRVIHFSPHITWQGTQAELDAMLAEGCPVGSASEIIAACWREAAEAKAYAAELEAKLAKAVEVEKAQQLMNYYAVEVVVYGATVSRLRNLEDAWTNLRTQATLADVMWGEKWITLKGENDE